MSESPESYWKAFDKTVEEGEPPRIPIGKVSVIRNFTPAERVASWLGHGRIYLFSLIILLLSLNLSLLSPLQMVRVLGLAGLLGWILSPMVGRFPAAQPWRLGLVGCVGVVLAGLLDWPSQMLVIGPTEKLILMDHARLYQSSLQQAASLKVAGPVILFWLIGPLLSVWAERKFYWLDFENAWSARRRALTLVCLTAPILFLLFYFGTLYLGGRDHSWVEPARKHDPLADALTRAPEEEFTLQAPQFKFLSNRDGQEIQNLLRDMPQAQLLAGIQALVPQLEKAGFRPTYEDSIILDSLSGRIELKGEPTEATARYGLFLWRLANDSKNQLDPWAQRELIRSQTYPVVAGCSEAEFREWEKRIQPLSLFQWSERDLDSLILQELERGRQQLSPKDHPLTLLGVEVGSRSFPDILHQIRQAAILADYSSRRGRFKPGLDERWETFFPKDSDPWYWPSQDITRFYGACGAFQKVRLVEDLEILKTILKLRAERFRTGRYPEKLPASSLSKLRYTSSGKTAVLSFKSAKGRRTWDWSLK